MVVYNTSTQETQIMYTNSKKEVHDKFQKGLLRNMVEVMGILEANKPFNPQGYATEFLWHGSRTENWISIIKNGLTTRPSSNVITTGSLFGSGIYFAPSPYKSYGYTSSTTAYWTRGDYKKSDYGVMALCEVAVGESYVPDTDRNYTKSYLEKEDFKVCGQKEKRQGCMEVA